MERAKSCIRGQAVVCRYRIIASERQRPRSLILSVSTLLRRRAIAPPARIKRVEMSRRAKPRLSPIAAAEVQRAVVIAVDLMVVHRPLTYTDASGWVRCTLAAHNGCEEAYRVGKWVVRQAVAKGFAFDTVFLGGKSEGHGCGAGDVSEGGSCCSEFSRASKEVDVAEAKWGLLCVAAAIAVFA
mmetsp:Transcript_18603/g.38900  ORF Transcript_18603/g.38900 Transcript_18603/m.38900 type:complete len:184 (-) Transcript_18603:2661-3212(-)